MMYVDYKFEMTPQGLVMLDEPIPNEKYMIQLKKTPFEVGDKFTLETTEDGRMFFKKDGPVQLNLEI